EKPGRRSAGAGGAQMLERTIRNVEDFLKSSLDYCHPAQVTFARMAVGELVEGLLFQVRSQVNGTQVTVSDAGTWKDVEADVMVDPSHLSYAFEIAVRQLTKQIGSESTVAIEIGRGARREGAGLEGEFHLRQP